METPIQSLVQHPSNKQNYIKAIVDKRFGPGHRYFFFYSSPTSTDFSYSEYTLSCYECQLQKLLYVLKYKRVSLKITTECLLLNILSEGALRVIYSTLKVMIVEVFFP